MLFKCGVSAHDVRIYGVLFQQVKRQHIIQSIFITEETVDKLLKEIKGEKKWQFHRLIKHQTQPSTQLHIQEVDLSHLHICIKFLILGLLVLLFDEDKRRLYDMHEASGGEKNHGRSFTRKTTGINTDATLQDEEDEAPGRDLRKLFGNFTSVWVVKEK